MDHNLTVDVCYRDEHLLELRTRFATAEWCGSATAYTDKQSLFEFSSALVEFSRKPDRSVELEAGNDDGVGYLSLRFYAIDALAHIGCHLRLATTAETRHRPEEIWKLSIELRTELGSVESFARALALMAESGSGAARLPFE